MDVNYRAGARLCRAVVETLENRCLLAANPLVSSTATPSVRAQTITPSISRPSVTTVSPAANSTGVPRDAAVTVDLFLPNSSLDFTTITTGTVFLERTSDQAIVPAIVSTTGGDDAIILQPSVLLDPNTSYTFNVTASVRDSSGQPINPFTMNFTTGTAGGTTDSSIAFQQVPQAPSGNVPWTTVRVGPDHQLWAGAEDGRIFRFPINADGSLGSPQVFTSLQTANGGQRLLTGFAFDPASTADNPILWVSNGWYGFSNAPDFSSKITRMSGPSLQTVQDVVVNLPRSVADHLTDQPVFGPDGALYFGQAAENSMGAPDPVWGMRAEQPLSAAILRLDVTRVTPGQPLNALTTDGGGTYDPNAPGAPLTIFASGVRNAFDLLWTSDNHLYAPVNGASAGGNVPAGPSSPAINQNPQVESDYLNDIAQGGYYGHPNPTLGHFVLDGGNPTAGTDAAEVRAYPAGTAPDPAWRPPVFDFGPHRSADGIIQYTGNAFNGALNGKILVAEYSAGADIVVLSRDASGNFTGQRRITGLSGLNNPLSLAEDPATGDIYVAELGGKRITLLVPITPHPAATPNANVVVFNGVAAGHSGAGPSRAQAVSITNTGTSPLTISGLSVVDDPSSPTHDAGAFAILSGGPTTLAPGQATTIQLRYTAGVVGMQQALLRLQTNDANNPVINIQLHGLGTAGQFGVLEPSLVQILRAYDIPTIVGAGPNDANASNSQYPENPDPSSQEVTVQRLVKAGAGPVTITPLASFDAASAPVLTFGRYVPGDPTDQTELFSIAQGDAQTVNPTALGATSFDPGSAPFGLFATFPGISTPDGRLDVHYSEDSLNVLDTAHPRKFRFFPMKNPDGSVVPNAFVIAAEDFNGPQFNSFVNFVGIIRNVAPASDAAGAPVLGLENLDVLPSNSRMIFNRIQIPNATVPDVVHDTGILRLHNTGDRPLVINSLTLSDATNWTIVNAPAPGTSIAPGGTLDLTIKFIAQTAPSHTDNQTNDTQPLNGGSVQAAGGVWNGTLTITTNDPVSPTRTVQLAGYWQHQSENENEPGLQTIINLLSGYGTTIAGAQQPQYPNNGSTPVYYGDEVASGLWSAADPSRPVGVQQLDAFHVQGNTATLSWYAAGSSSTHTLFQQAPHDAQTLFPHITGSSKVAAGSFSTSGNFGWNVDGEFSEDSRNVTDKSSFHRSGHAVRFYPVRDGQGQIVPNEWIITEDYENSEFDNSDFQDLVYVVTNMRPAATPPTPADLQAVSVNGVTLQWAPSQYTNVGYNVYRATAAAGPFVKLTPSPIRQATYTDAAAFPGVANYYRVTGVDMSSNAESLPNQASAVGTATGGGGTITPPGTMPPIVASGTFGTVPKGMRHVVDTLTPTDTIRIYSFTLSSLSKVVINLGGFKKNCDLQLLDANGNVIATSSHPRRRAEAIRMTLGPGTYYIKAYLIDGTGPTKFRVTLTVHPVPVKKPKVVHTPKPTTKSLYVQIATRAARAKKS